MPRETAIAEGDPLVSIASHTTGDGVYLLSATSAHLLELAVSLRDVGPSPAGDSYRIPPSRNPYYRWILCQRTHNVL